MYIVKGERPSVLPKRQRSGTTVGISRQKQRTEVTRRKLVQAAEHVFARDGFEAARLEDIATLAGYSRGAFYANFASKEDIFFALLDQWVSRRIEEVNSLLRRENTYGGRRRALREHYAQVAKDRRVALLSLEFKLFAIRHPEAHARLRARQQRIRACSGTILKSLMGRPLPISSTVAAIGLAAFSTAMLLEYLVDSKDLTDAELRRLLEIFFDAIVHEKPAMRGKRFTNDAPATLRRPVA
jgi:AcrR family transcriptional regulator